MSSPISVEFFFDIGSPYTYLASTQVEDVARRLGVSLRWRPFLLGGVFKASGNDMPARVAAKGVYMYKDLNRFATLYGVPFKFSSRFPLNTLRTQRSLSFVSLNNEAAVPTFSAELYRSYWVDDQDVSTDESIAKAATAAGLDAKSVVAGIDDARAKDKLRADTDEAVKRGAFGAPTFFVGDEMFFGNDRIVLLEAHVQSLQGK